MIPQLSPIKLPTLKKLCMSDKNSCRPESWTAMLMVFTSEGPPDLPTGQSFFIDDEQTIWIWESEQDRLWLLGHSHCSVNYFSFETGHPFLWKSESLLKKSMTESFSFETVSFHLSIGIDYWQFPTSDVLPEKDGLPLLVWEMEKKKLLPAGSKKFLRQFYTQMQFEKLGFTTVLSRTRIELLQLLIQTTCETTINTVQKLHPEIWKLICVEGEVKASETKLYPQKNATESEKLDKAQEDTWLILNIPKKETESSQQAEAEAES